MKAEPTPSKYDIILLQRYEQGVGGKFQKMADGSKIRKFKDAADYTRNFIVQEEIKVSDERWHGSSPYVEIQVPMQNLNGSTRAHV
jgi:hypothetical protein